MEKLTIIKVGGALVEDAVALSDLLDRFVVLSGAKVLVHGGGRRATDVADRMGLHTQMIEGRRVTDLAMLEVVTMVYGGGVNKNIVAKLQERGVNALGLTGADLNYMQATRRAVKAVDYGYVGDISSVNVELVSLLLERGVLPVLAPLSHDGKGCMLNVNADTIAAEAAVALSSMFDVELIYCFEKPGVLRNSDDDNSLIPKMQKADFEKLRAEGAIHAGMIPKLENCFSAIERGVSRVRICNVAGIEGDGTLLI